MLKTQIKHHLSETIKKLGFETAIDIVLTIPEKPEFGDYSTNIPLQLSKQESKNHYQNPHQIANAILEKFGHPPYLERVELAGAGFINFFIKDENLMKVILADTSTSLSINSMRPESKEDPEKILVEYGQPNTHKPFHIGHLRTLSLGESLARLLESQGKEIFKVSYGGDIGPHIAKAIWGILQFKAEFEAIKAKNLTEKASFLGESYMKGAQAYEESPQTKDEINQINLKLYQSNNEYQDLWKETSDWSKAYLDSLYSRLGTEFDRQLWESELHEEGTELVKKNIGEVFIEDDGAIIFPGENFGLHNRVFITSKGYPTYEAKELGVTQREQEIFPYDKALHVVANEQDDYFKVVIKAIEEIDPAMKGKKIHVSYGMVNRTTGKMSSRKGNVVTAEELIEEVKEEIRKNYPQKTNKSYESVLEKIAIGAIKFYMLKFSPSSNITFDIAQSVSLQGDSGPYIQYTYARTQSVLAKDLREKYTFDPKRYKLEDDERAVVRQLEYFDSIVDAAAREFKPNDLCVYLLDLARTFNLFYQKYPILMSQEVDFRLALTHKVGETLKEGLYLLGIEAPDRM